MTSDAVPCDGEHRSAIYGSLRLYALIRTTPLPVVDTYKQRSRRFRRCGTGSQEDRRVFGSYAAIPRRRVLKPKPRRCYLAPGAAGSVPAKRKHHPSITVTFRCEIIDNIFFSTINIFISTLSARLLHSSSPRGLAQRRFSGRAHALQHQRRGRTSSSGRCCPRTRSTREFGTGECPKSTSQSGAANVTFRDSPASAQPSPSA